MDTRARGARRSVLGALCAVPCAWCCDTTHEPLLPSVPCATTVVDVAWARDTSAPYKSFVFITLLLNDKQIYSVLKIN